MQFRHLSITLILFSTILFVMSNQIAYASIEDNLTFCCAADNDLYALLESKNVSCQRYGTPLEAVQNAPVGTAVAVLADGYPETKTDISVGVFDLAKTRNLRLYVEYPKGLPSEIITSGLAAQEIVNGHTSDALIPTGDIIRASHQEMGTGLQLGFSGVFNGSGSNRYLASDLSGSIISGANAFELWFQSDTALQSDPPFQYLAEFGAPPGYNHPGIIFGYDNQELEIFYGGRTDGLVINDTNWHHILIVIYGNGTVGVADKIVAYLDGQIVNGLTDTISEAGIDLSGALSVGGIILNHTEGFDGMIDELAVYDLTHLPDEAAVDSKASDLAQHYLLGYSSSDYTQDILNDGPAMYWNFNEVPNSGSELSFLPDAQTTEWERAVVSSDFFQPDIESLRIMEISGIHYLPVEVDNPDLVLSRVAGYDTATFGLTEAQHPLLFEMTSSQAMLVGTTKLSHFITGRYSPAEVWPSVWKHILLWLCPGETIPELTFVPKVRPAYNQSDPLPANPGLTSLNEAAQWFVNSRFLRDPNWPQSALNLSDSDGIGDTPDASWPVGDGSLGMIETYNSTLKPDGTQLARYGVRGDCNAEVAMAAAVNGQLNNNSESEILANNLMDYVWFDSLLAQGVRADPTNPSYGLLCWHLPTSYWGASYWGDDNARAILGSLVASVSLESERWDESILRCILANFRTTGKYGFRDRVIRDWDLQANGWESYYNGAYTDYSTHFQGYLWACYLWAYHKTGYEPFLTRTKTALSMLMDNFNNWDENVLTRTGALCRALLPLAWLVRVEDTPEHRNWLNTVVNELLSYQDASGAIREGGMNRRYAVSSNAAYGTAETFVIQEDGDPAADMLYASNFALLGLREAIAATNNNSTYIEAESKLADFLYRIQIQSESHPELDGAWFRSFDFEKWDYWGSNADVGWGVWCTESGWTVSWISTMLALREAGTSLWNITQSSSIDQALLDQILPVMLPWESKLTQPIEVVNKNKADNLIPLGNVARTDHQALGSGLNLRRAVTFDGTGARLFASDLTGDNLVAPYAVEFWVQVDTASQSDPADQYLLEMQTDGICIVYGFDENKLQLLNENAPVSEFIINDRQWHHIVFVVYGNSSGGVEDKIVAYKDGQAVAFSTDITTSVDIELLQSMAVGGRVTGNTNSFIGMIDEVVLYDLNDFNDTVSLDTKSLEIASHYNDAFTNNVYTREVLIDCPSLYWNFDERDQTCLEADLNCDNSVDVLDLLIIVNNWLNISHKLPCQSQ